MILKSLIVTLILLLILLISGNSLKHSFPNVVKNILRNVIIFSIPTIFINDNNNNVVIAVDRNNIKYEKSISGVSFYNYPNNNNENNEIAKVDSKVTIDVKGYLAGRNGWEFIDTVSQDSSIRLDLKKSNVIEGLKLGLIGTNDIPPMHKGDKRRLEKNLYIFLLLNYYYYYSIRLVIPSRLGYKTKSDEPLPIDEGNKRRLYSTVFNNERGITEKKELGDSIVGEIILDVTLKRVKN